MGCSDRPRVKINFDAAFNSQKRESCSGLVVRNEKGEVICSGTILNANIPLTFATEVTTCFQALDLGIQLGLSEVEVEGDSWMVIRKLQEEKKDRSEIAALIKDSKHRSLSFRYCVFRFIYRDSNKVAHFIATEGLKKGETIYLMNRVPPGLRPWWMRSGGGRST